jgi:hypothetical protein
LLLAGSVLGLAARDALGHPSSGIVVDAQGQVYFQDATGRAIWKIDSQGRLSKYFERFHPAPAPECARFAAGERPEVRPRARVLPLCR